MMTHADFNQVSVIRPYEQIVQQVERAIRDERYPRGSKLPTERELAESFGVSRSVVREAIKVLAANGLVESRQGSGIFVRNNPIATITRAFTLSVSPNAESIERLFEFRAVLEAEAARFAALRRTDDDLAPMRDALDLMATGSCSEDWDTFAISDTSFHQAVAAACGNPYLSVAVATARDMQRDVVHLFADRAGQMQIARDHHEEIFGAIAARDADRAAASMATHIRYTLGVVQTELPAPGHDGSP